ncbi:MAG: aminoacyl-tRNA hydrolase [Candidatus Omnitrophota bacterium]|nr:MAG: aminoacyl-tRNA hydrolase [Candidatus Omnitrophota bacterium]
MKLIVGLGNPGLRYKNTRHNIGFLIIAKLSKKFNIPVKKRKYKGILGKGSIRGEKIALFMPQTYMNLSGEAVGEAVKKGKINLEDILVIYDDINLKLGLMRLRKKGSSGGHNGMESLIEHLGTTEFPRLRIGISGNRETGDIVNFVLSPFDSAEKPLLKDIINQGVECVVAWLELGPDKAMTRFNSR